LNKMGLTPIYQPRPDEGSQFTSFAFTNTLREAGIRISMDGHGRGMDNIEQLWRSLKYRMRVPECLQRWQRGTDRNRTMDRLLQCRSATSARPEARRPNRPYALSSERDWLLKRLAEQPDVTLRALLAELAGRGIKVSYYAVWHSSSTKASVSKKPARQRAGSPRRRQTTGATGKSIEGGLILLARVSSTRPGPRST
jgi:hypothetical protein